MEAIRPSSITTMGRSSRLVPFQSLSAVITVRIPTDYCRLSAVSLLYSSKNSTATEFLTYHVNVTAL